MEGRLRVTRGESNAASVPEFARLVWGFSCQVVVLVCSRFFVRSGKAVLRPVALRSGSRSARKGSRDRNASQGLAACRLAVLVFRSALTPEHAER